MEAIWTISFKIRAKIEVIKHMFCVLLIISRQFVTAFFVEQRFVFDTVYSASGPGFKCNYFFKNSNCISSSSLMVKNYQQKVLGSILGKARVLLFLLLLLVYLFCFLICFLFLLTSPSRGSAIHVLLVKYNYTLVVARHRTHLRTSIESKPNRYHSLNHCCR